MRPRAKELAVRAMRDGKLGVGPWFVQPDEFLVGGESLVRNLYFGVDELARMGGVAQRAAYLPDNFGHTGQLPQVLLFCRCVLFNFYFKKMLLTKNRTFAHSTRRSTAASV